MGAFLNKPKTEKHIETGGGNGLQYVVASEQGWRVEMEDAHSAVIGVHPHLADWCYFAVFDGHAGAETSAYCSRHLLPQLVQQLQLEGRRQLQTTAGGSGGGCNNSCDASSATNEAAATPTATVAAVAAAAANAAGVNGCVEKEMAVCGDSDGAIAAPPPPAPPPSSHPSSTDAAIAPDAATAGDSGQLSLSPAPSEQPASDGSCLQWLGNTAADSASTSSSGGGGGGTDSADTVAECIRQGFFSTDRCMLDDSAVAEDKSGSTAVCALVSPRHIYLINCGDSRALLCRGGAIALATVDHKPSCADERARIVAAGGTVLMQRVNGSLAVSRALGDFVYKEVPDLEPHCQLVSPEPDILRCERQPAADEFLVLACDGVWDVLKNEDLCAFIRCRLRVTHSLQDIAHQLLDTCFHMGSKDNMSVIIVLFEAAPAVDPEAVQRDEQMRCDIIKAVDEYFERFVPPAPHQTQLPKYPSVSIATPSELGLVEPSATSLNINVVVRFVLEKEIKNLPDGAGIRAMWQFIEDYVTSRMSARNGDRGKSDDLASTLFSMK